MKPSFALLFSLVAALSALPPAAVASTDPAAALSDSRNWPFYVSPRESTVIDGTRLFAGVRGVLLRVEDDNTVVVDFGRDGIHRLPVESTNVIAQAEAIAAGVVTKELPNFARMTTSAVVRHSPDGLPDPITPEMLAEYRRLVLVYTDEVFIRLPGTPEQLRRLRDELAADDTTCLFIPLNVAGFEALGERPFPMPFLTWQIALTAPETFQHEPETSGATLALIDANGAWLGKTHLSVETLNTNGFAAFEEAVNELLEELP